MNNGKEKEIYKANAPIHQATSFEQHLSIRFDILTFVNDIKAHSYYIVVAVEVTSSSSVAEYFVQKYREIKQDGRLSHIKHREIWIAV